jgi:hypothetical protein
VLTCIRLQLASKPPVNTTSSSSGSGSNPATGNSLLHLHVLCSCIVSIRKFDTHYSIPWRSGSTATNCCNQPAHC